MLFFYNTPECVMKISMNSPKLIVTELDLEEFANHTSGTAHIAVDSESNSYYAYRPRTCLIQISTEHNDFIIDPLSLKDLSPLAHLFADPKVEKVLHAAENDLIGLKRDFRFTVRNIFDTAVACRLLGRKKLGLARILSEEFGFHLDKRFQRCDWERRPLSPEQLYYAQLDTHFLIKLRHRLHRQLQDQNVLSLAQNHFARLESFRAAAAKGWDPEGYLRLKGAEALSAASLKALKALFAYRERLARRTNKAPFRIINNECLVNLARELPTDHSALLQIRGLPSRFKGKSRNTLLRIIRESRG
jgi:ribonuclease D